MKKRFLTLPILAGIMWGSAGIFVRFLHDFGMDRYTILSIRMIVASVLMFGCILIFNRDLLKIKLKDLWIFLGAGLVGILGLNLCYNEAVGKLTLSFAAILLSFTPIFAIIFSALFFKEKITRRKIICMIFAIIGCALASRVFENQGGITCSFTGILMGLLSAIFCSLYGIFSKFANNRGYSTYTIILYSLLFSFVALIPLTNWGMIQQFITESVIQNTFFSIIHSGFTSILPYAFYSIALGRMENGKVSILAGGGEPIAAVIFGAMFFSEMPTVLSLIGLVITIAALTFLCLPKKEKCEVKELCD